MPKLVAQRIVSLQRKFFWGNSTCGNPTAPFIKWSSIELPKSLGGLGVGNILYKNLVLLFKWWWRYSATDSSFWKRILQSVHRIKGSKASSVAFSAVKDGVWGQMMRHDDDTSKVRAIVEDGMILQVGKGTSILFWFDRWCDNGPLQRLFPRLFSLSTQKVCLIAQMGQWQGNVWVWQLSWRRILFDWEQAEVLRLQAILEVNQPTRDRDDWVSWRHTDVGSFPVKSIVEKLYESFTPILSKQCIQAIWRNPSPPRAQVTLWLASLEKLKTGEKLVAQGILAVQQAMCPFCDSVIESNTHVLFSCSFS